MELWQQEGFASFKAWIKAESKKRYAAKKAALASPPPPPQEPPPPPPVPPFESMPVQVVSMLESVELDKSTIAVLNPSTQEDALIQTPPRKRTLLQPSGSELTPGERNIKHRLEYTSPRGTHSASAEYETAVATPEGENDEGRERRLAAERQRRHRAREEVQGSIESQVEAERAALAEKVEREAQLQAMRARHHMRWARREGRVIPWEDLAPSCRAAASKFGFMRGMWTHNHCDSVRGQDLATY